MENENYLFVYGTLRDKYGLKLKDRVSKEMEHVGKAKVTASLYDLGRYPGVVKEAGSGEVVGDVFRITDPDKVFKVLDKCEGENFSREKEEVKLRGGEVVSAWVYWYNQSPQGKHKIRFKDYLNYLKTKKTA